MEHVALFKHVVKENNADTRIFELRPKFKSNRFVAVVSVITPYGYEMTVWPSSEQGMMALRNGALCTPTRTHFKEHRQFLERMGYIVVGDLKRKPRDKNAKANSSDSVD